MLVLQLLLQKLLRQMIQDPDHGECDLCNEDKDLVLALKDLQKFLTLLEQLNDFHLLVKNFCLHHQRLLVLLVCQ